MGCFFKRQDIAIANAFQKVLDEFSNKTHLRYVYKIII